MREIYHFIYIAAQSDYTEKHRSITHFDATRFIREIPGTSPDEACLRLKEIIKELMMNKKILVKCTCNIQASVRVCGCYSGKYRL